MSASESPDSAQVKLMREWGLGFEKKDVGLIAKNLHKGFRLVSHPRSLGMPEENREEYLQRITEAMTLWTDNEPTVHAIIEAPGKVIVHATSETKTSIGVEMNRESIYIAHIVTDEDGSLKIKQMEEFTDSRAYLDFSQAVAKPNRL